jgi:hypothetical protein
MFVDENTNGKIKAIRFNINNDIRLFLKDGDYIDISLENEDDFVKKVKEIDETISDIFLKKVYEIGHKR